MDLFHITLTAQRENRLPLFVDEPHYLEALRRLGAVCGGCLALFALIAEHLHLVALLSRVMAGYLARTAVLTLRPIVATAFAPSYIKPVASRSHMRWLLRYLLEQPTKHRMSGHPALWVGSCFPELVGVRRISGLELCIQRALPGYQPATAMSIVGLPGTGLELADASSLRAAGAVRLRNATAAVLGTAPELAGTTTIASRGRRAFAQLASRVGIHRCEIVAALQIGSKAFWRLARPVVDRDLLATIARRVALEDLVQTAMTRGGSGATAGLAGRGPRAVEVAG